MSHRSTAPQLAAALHRAQTATNFDYDNPQPGTSHYPTTLTSIGESDSDASQYLEEDDESGEEAFFSDTTSRPPHVPRMRPPIEAPTATQHRLKRSTNFFVTLPFKNEPNMKLILSLLTLKFTLLRYLLCTEKYTISKKFNFHVHAFIQTTEKIHILYLYFVLIKVCPQ